MTYLFDENFSKKYVAALAALGEDVKHSAEEFGAGAPDEEWIPQVGARNWVLVSLDRRITRNPQQQAVLEAAGIVSFFGAGGVANFSVWDQFIWLARAWPAIKHECALLWTCNVHGQCESQSGSVA